MKLESNLGNNIKNNKITNIVDIDILLILTFIFFLKNIIIATN